MTTYTAITDTETGFEKPVTISLMRRLRDNPLAIQEGDATAPSIYTGIVNKHVSGGIGSIAFLAGSPTGSFTAGSTYAGSGLRFGGAKSSSSTSPFTYEAYEGGITPAGTWKALGTAIGNWPTTVFIRIA